MFGEKAGAERHQSALNQFVVSKLSAPSVGYWVLHRRAEEPMSVLIAALREVGKSWDDVMRAGSAIVSMRTLSEVEWRALVGEGIEPTMIVCAFGQPTQRVKLADVADVAIKRERSWVIGEEHFDAA